METGCHFLIASDRESGTSSTLASSGSAATGGLVPLINKVCLHGTCRWRRRTSGPPRAAACAARHKRSQRGSYVPIDDMRSLRGSPSPPEVELDPQSAQLQYHCHAKSIKSLLYTSDPPVLLLYYSSNFCDKQHIVLLALLSIAFYCCGL